MVERSNMERDGLIKAPWLRLRGPLFLTVIGAGVLIGGTSCVYSSSTGSSAGCPPMDLTPPYRWAPAWSPDGRKIAFARGDSKWKLYVAGADGGHERELTREATQKGLITPDAWSSDNRMLAFAGKGGIVAMKNDGSQKRQLTRNRQDDYPAWSPDGRKLAFVRGDYIFVMNANGTDQHRLTWHRAASADGGGGPTWSPDGQKIAFPAFSSRADRIIVVNANGTKAHRLTRNPYDSETAYEYNPAWSPAGTKIAFTANSGSGGASWIDVIDAKGRHQRQLTNLKRDGVCENDFTPAWAPSGAKIVFARMSQNGDDPRLYIMNADGTNQRPLVTK
jgi:TolB protein